MNFSPSPTEHPVDGEFSVVTFVDTFIDIKENKSTLQSHTPSEPRQMLYNLTDVLYHSTVLQRAFRTPEILLLSSSTLLSDQEHCGNSHIETDYLHLMK